MSYKVLLVEDDMILLEMYKSKFEMEGHKVIIATDGEEALDQLAAHTPDIIILDIVMPKMNGFETLKEIKKSPKLRAVPVILLTNLGESDIDMDRELSYSLGVKDYLIKSRHTPDDIIKKVTQVINQKVS